MGTISIDPLTRIEGHASVRIDIDDKKNIESARMHVKELRGFEKILEGMRLEDMPLITARICGVCPAAHHIASAKTLDLAYGVEPPEAGHMLRELMYMGHMIHSHALSLFVLSGPDLIMGLDADPVERNIVGMLKIDPDTTKKALTLRSIGQKILENIGGRGVHPVTATAGGLTFSLDSSLRKKLLEYAKNALKLGLFGSQIIKDLLSGFSDKYPDIVTSLEHKTFYMGTVKHEKLNFYDGLIRVINPEGKIAAEFNSEDYADYIVEEAVDWSYLKPTYFDKNEKNIYRTGTLARINVADQMETPLAQKELEAFRNEYGRPCHYTLMHHYARMIELVYSCEKAVMLLNNDAIMGETRTEVTQLPQSAIAHIEAPRGTLVHDYTVHEKGVVEKVNLIVATQQNYMAINHTIKKCAEYFIDRSESELLNGIEFSIRTYDPCLSCSTHAIGRMPLEINVFQNGKLLKKIRRM